jgi:tetratricopeptide (TPR) repeat protein
LNARAYGRALAGVELDEALVDIEEALTAWPDNADFLDTRGYIHFLRGDAEEALEDLDRALEIASQQRIIILDRTARSGASLQQVERLKRQWNEKLSVLYHHRGEAREKLHQLDEAAADLNQAEKLGYNPADGVF